MRLHFIRTHDVFFATGAVAVAVATSCMADLAFEITVFRFQGANARLMLDDHGLQLANLGAHLIDSLFLLGRDLTHLFVDLVHDNHLQIDKKYNLQKNVHLNA